MQNREHQSKVFPTNKVSVTSLCPTRKLTRASTEATVPKAPLLYVTDDYLQLKTPILGEQEEEQLS